MTLSTNLFGQDTRLFDEDRLRALEARLVARLVANEARLTALEATPAWTTYTPAITQGVAVTSTVTYARYRKIGKLVSCAFELIVTSTGTAATALVVSLPFAAVTAQAAKGTGMLYDASASTPYSGIWTGAATTTVSFVGDWGGNNVWGVVPNIAIANPDLLRGAITYEAAT